MKGPASRALVFGWQRTILVVVLVFYVLRRSPFCPSQSTADAKDEATRALELARLANAAAAPKALPAPPRPTSSAVCAVGAPRWQVSQVPLSVLEQPLVTIITTCHDADRALLVETARCVLAQTSLSWEWVVVDDFSIDARALAFLHGLDPRIRLVRSADFVRDSRGNLGRARNVGAGVARGEFIVFIDADDLMEPTAIEKWLYYLAAHPDAHFVNGYTRGFGAFEYDWSRSFNPSLVFREENQVAVTSMHRRASFSAIGGFPVREGGLEDWELWFRYAAAGMWGGTVPEFLFWYRRRTSHSDRWGDFGEGGTARFQAQMRDLFPALMSDESKWPPPPLAVTMAQGLDVAASVSDRSRWPPPGGAGCSGKSVRIAGDSATPRAAEGLRMLLLVDSIRSGVHDREALATIKTLLSRHWHVSVIALERGDDDAGQHFRSATPDLLVLANLALPGSFPYIISAAIYMRQPHVVLVGGMLAGAIVSSLRQSHANMTFLQLDEQHGLAN